MARLHVLRAEEHAAGEQCPSQRQHRSYRLVTQCICMHIHMHMCRISMIDKSPTQRRAHRLVG